MLLSLHLMRGRGEALNIIGCLGKSYYGIRDSTLIIGETGEDRCSARRRP
jgi:hypothetical protein